MDKKFAIQIVILLIVIFASLAYSYGGIPNFSFVAPTQTEITEVVIGNYKITAEIADDTGERQKGLGGRDALAQDSGMLFVFTKPDRYTFWMKGLRFPLDMIWIKDNTVVDIIKNAQIPDVNLSDEQLPRYMPNQVVDSVLEVNAGFVDKNNIKVGDKIEVTSNK